MLIVERPVETGEHDEPFDLAEFLERVRPAWMTRAACKGRTDEFFTPVQGNRDARWVAKAIAICQTCPVKNECLDHALSHPVDGVWGGHGERARQRMRARR